MAGSGAYWFHDVLGEGCAAVREMFGVEATTVPDLPLEDAGWEDDERHPRTAGDLTEAFELLHEIRDRSSSIATRPFSTQPDDTQEPSRRRALALPYRRDDEHVDCGRSG